VDMGMFTYQFIIIAHKNNIIICVFLLGDHRIALKLYCCFI